MAKSIATNVKSKALDLGKLQDEFESSKTQLSKATEALSKAMDAHQQSKKRHDSAETALKEGTKAVLG